MTVTRGVPGFPYRGTSSRKLLSIICIKQLPSPHHGMVSITSARPTLDQQQDGGRSCLCCGALHVIASIQSENEWCRSALVLAQSLPGIRFLGRGM